MVGYYFDFNNLGPEFLRYVQQDFFQASPHAVHEHWLAILGTPDNMVLARVHKVAVAFEWNVCSHIRIVPLKCI